MCKSCRYAKMTEAIARRTLRTPKRMSCREIPLDWPAIVGLGVGFTGDWRPTVLLTIFEAKVMGDGAIAVLLMSLKWKKMSDKAERFERGGWMREKANLEGIFKIFSFHHLQCPYQCPM